jgi:hypothetical protein
MRSEIFPYCPEAQDGYLWPKERPLLGENLASGCLLPEDPLNGGRPQLRHLEGTVIWP